MVVFDQHSVHACRTAAARKLTCSCSCVCAGDFNDLEPHLGDYPDIYGDDESSFGSKVAAPLRLLAFLGGAGLFLLGP